MKESQAPVQNDAASVARAVLESEAQALAALAGRLDEPIARAVELLASRRGKVVASGIGKSGLVARQIAATLTSTGTPSYFLHPVEALHGDAGLVEEGDVALVVSKSGAGDEVDSLLPLFARLGVPIVALTAHADSPLARAAKVTLPYGAVEEAGPVPDVPTTSAVLSLAVGHALAAALAVRRGFEAKDFHFLHPGGVLGRRAALRVADVMHQGDAVPHVEATDSIRRALLEIMEKRLGLTCIVDEKGRLAGILTDGDLKRILIARGDEGILETAVGSVMNATPKTIESNALVAAAVRVMEENQPGPITALVVPDDAGRPIGVLHLHDCLRLGVR